MDGRGGAEGRRGSVESDRGSDSEWVDVTEADAAAAKAAAKTGAAAQADDSATGQPALSKAVEEVPAKPAAAAKKAAAAAAPEPLAEKKGGLPTLSNNLLFELD